MSSPGIACAAMRAQRSRRCTGSASCATTPRSTCDAPGTARQRSISTTSVPFLLGCLQRRRLIRSAVSCVQTRCSSCDFPPLSPRPAYKSTFYSLFGQWPVPPAGHPTGELNGLWLRSAAEQGKGGLTPERGDRWRHRPLPQKRVKGRVAVLLTASLGKKKQALCIPAKGHVPSLGAGTASRA